MLLFKNFLGSLCTYRQFFRNTPKVTWLNPLEIIFQNNIHQKTDQFHLSWHIPPADLHFFVLLEIHASAIIPKLLFILFWWILCFLDQISSSWFTFSFRCSAFFSTFLSPFHLFFFSLRLKFYYQHYVCIQSGKKNSCKGMSGKPKSPCLGSLLALMECLQKAHRKWEEVI